MACFLTLEGIEGSGKTLQMQYLGQEFHRRDMPFILTREPGGTSFGMELRKILLRLDGVQRDPVSELLLYLADRFQHLKEVIEPSLQRGVHVISDRYHDATLAYQAYARGIGFEKTDRLAQILELRVPDVTIVLDLDVELGLRRARLRNEETKDEQWGRFEAEAIDFHRRVRTGYRLLAEREPERIRLVDASGRPEEVRDRILTLLCQTGVFDRAGEA